MNVDLLIKENKELIKELSEEKQRYKEMWFIANNSLAKYRNIEKEIGCSLEVAFKALKNGIYTSESELDPEYEVFEVRGIEKNGLSVISKLCGYAECDFLCEYKDYKKTWWLKENREE